MIGEFKDFISGVGLEHDWQVFFTEENKFLTIVEFQRYTSAGQDYSFSIDVNDNDPQDFLDNLEEFYNDFDYEEEAMLWVGKDGHGKNGAPYFLTDILKDTKEIDDCLHQLYNAFEKDKDKLFKAARHKIRVQITEYLQKTIEVDAFNEEYAIAKAQDMINDDEVILTGDDFTSREYDCLI